MGYNLVIVLFALSRVGGLLRYKHAVAVAVGDEAPDFELPKRGGGGMLRLSEQRGQPVVLVFLRGDWCPMCHIQMRAYQRMEADLAARDVLLLGISQSTGEEVVSDSLGVTFTIVEDPPNEVAQRYGVLLEDAGPHGDAPMPVSFLIGADGSVSHVPHKASAFAFDDLKEITQRLEQLPKSVRAPA